MFRFSLVGVNHTKGTNQMGMNCTLHAYVHTHNKKRYEDRIETDEDLLYLIFGLLPHYLFGSSFSVYLFMFQLLVGICQAIKMELCDMLKFNLYVIERRRDTNTHTYTHSACTIAKYALHTIGRLFLCALRACIVCVYMELHK